MVTANYDLTAAPSFRTPCHEPMCAGVVLSKQKRLLFSLATDDRWKEVDGQLIIPIGGIGGGQEPDESFIDCALREAEEEIGVTVSVLHSPTTYMQDELGYVSEARLEELPAPLFYRRVKHESALLHMGVFRARAIGEPEPKDIPGMIWLSPLNLSDLTKGVAIKDIESINAQLTLKDKISENAQLVIQPNSLEEFMMQCYQQFAIQW